MPRQRGQLLYEAGGPPQIPYWRGHFELSQEKRTAENERQGHVDRRAPSAGETCPTRCRIAVQHDTKPSRPEAMRRLMHMLLQNTVYRA
jgi:hypothetical protein